MDPSPAPPPVSLGQLLLERTPRVIVTPAIIAVDVALFAAMVATSGQAAFSPETLVTWGAQFAPAIAEGEWWRLLTAMWLHGHPPHLILNALVLWQLGAIVERLLGPLVFLIVYVLTGVLAAIVSLEYHGATGLSVGASGAIFGIAGVLLVIAFTGGDRRLRRPTEGVTTLGGRLETLPTEPPPLPRAPGLGAMLAELQGGLIGFVAYNAIAGFVLPRVDNAAHFGGLAGGVVVGWLVGRHSLRARPRLLHTLIPIALTAALAAWEVQRMAGLQDVRIEWARDDADEAHETFRAALADVRAGRRSPESLAAEIERDVLPPLDAARQRADALIRAAFARVREAERRDPYGRMTDWRHLPGFRADLQEASAWAVYLSKRHEAWRWRIRALRENTPELIEQARRHEEAAARVLDSVLARPRPENLR